MRKVLVLLLAVSLFTSCKDNKKTDRRDDRNYERDDYRNNDDRNNDRNNDDRNNDRNNDDRNSRNSDYNNDDRDNRNNRDNGDDNSSNWTSADRNTFIDNCVPEAEKNGLSNRQATSYCTCMQKGVERMYPDKNDVDKLDMNSAEVKRMVQDCNPLQ